MILPTWKALKELVIVLEIPYNATVALQNACITLSDGFGILTRMRLHLEACTTKQSFKTKLAHHLVESVANRSEAIFSNPQMECSVYLDPRFRDVILKDREVVERTKSNLINLYHRLNHLKRPHLTTTAHSVNSSSDLHLSFDEQNALKNFIHSNRSNNTNIHASIEDAIDSFMPDILPSDKSVLEFWETQKESMLYDLAMAVYSIPPTQTQVERDFSSVSHIFTERRYQLSQKRLENILLIHFNKDLFFNIKQEKINKM